MRRRLDLMVMDTSARSPARNIVILEVLKELLEYKGEEEKVPLRYFEKQNHIEFSFPGCDPFRLGCKDLHDAIKRVQGGGKRQWIRDLFRECRGIEQIAPTNSKRQDSSPSRKPSNKDNKGYKDRHILAA